MNTDNTSRFTHRFVTIVFSLVCCIMLLGGCQKAYYGAMEKLGVHKRDIMVDRVEEARDSQHEAKEQFASALEEFNHVLNFHGGTLQEKYEAINTAYEDSRERAEDVTSRIDSVENVAEALFDEWKEELTQYTSDKLRRQSAQQLKDTRTQYGKMMRAMRKAEDSMRPVLNTLHDQVLFLKHNLNAQAIASIQEELGNVQQDVSSLIAEMEASIAEANQFIATMGSGGNGGNE